MRKLTLGAPVVTDGKNGHKLKLEKFGQPFKGLMLCPQKKKLKKLCLVLHLIKFVKFGIFLITLREYFGYELRH